MMNAAEFGLATGVSRETLEHLQAYAETLLRWQKTINLVGPATLPELWSRHFLDSAQLFPLLPNGVRTLIDLGSGAGFPGLVLAIMGVSDVHLVESDGRKCAFLREAARAAKTAVRIHNRRIEALDPLTADVVTARALAPLTQLLDYSARFWGPRTMGLYLKGRDAEAELTAAAECWTFEVERFPSCSDPSGVVLRVRGLERRG